MPTADQALDVAALRDQFLNVVFDSYELTLSADRMHFNSMACKIN